MEIKKAVIYCRVGSKEYIYVVDAKKSKNNKKHKTK